MVYIGTDFGEMEGRGCVRILLQSWFQIIFNLSWLTMWVSDHLVKRNIIHTASQGEGYSCNADEMLS